MARRPLTDEQRNTNTKARAYARMRATDVSATKQQAEIETEHAAQREAYHSQQRRVTESGLASDRRNRAITSTVVSTATPSSDSGIVMTTLFVMFGLVIMYMLVTNKNSTGWLDNLGAGIHAFITSNTPLFTETTKATS